MLTSPQMINPTIAPKISIIRLATMWLGLYKFVEKVTTFNPAISWICLFLPKFLSKAFRLTVTSIPIVSNCEIMLPIS